MSILFDPVFLKFCKIDCHVVTLYFAHCSELVLIINAYYLLRSLRRICSSNQLSILMQLHDGVKKSGIMGFCDPCPGEPKKLLVWYTYNTQNFKVKSCSYTCLSVFFGAFKCIQMGAIR